MNRLIRFLGIAVLSTIGVTSLLLIVFWLVVFGFNTPHIGH